MQVHNNRWPFRFCDHEDLPVYEPSVTTDAPRIKWDWESCIDLAMDHIERVLRARKATAEPIELGRLGLRTKQRLRAPCAAFALHFLYEQINTHGDTEGGKFAHKSALHHERGTDWLEMESIQMDYDTDNSGNVDDFEKNQPIPARFIRGG